MIDTQAIRNKILDLAIRGKISKQYENESVDFGHGVTANIPYCIPCNWKWVTIESIITKDVGGGTPSKSVDEYWKNGTIPWMSVKDFSSAKNGVLEDTIDHITQTGLENSSSNLVDVDAIIICMRMALGKIVKLKQPMAINQDLRAIWLNDCVDRDYFVFFYSTLKVEGHGMTVAGINKKQLMAYLLPLPPLAEQRRIVERIEQAFSVLDTIDSLQAQYADNLTVLKAKLIDAAIQGKLVDQRPEEGTGEELYQQIQREKQALIKAGKLKKEKPLSEISEDEIPFDIPENWKWVRFANLMLTMSTGPFGSMLHKADYIENGIPLVNPANITDGQIVPSRKMMVSKETRNRLESYVLRRGMIVMGRRGEMGRCAVVSENEDGWLCGTGSFFMTPSSALFVLYLSMFFSTPYAKHYLGGESIGTTMSNLNHTILCKMPIPLPPFAEQKRIVARLEELLPLCSTLK